MRLFFAVLWTVSISVQGQTILAPRAIPEVSGTLSEARDQGLEVSLTVVDIGSGSVLTASQGDEPRVPASAMKILSAGAALLGLGADHAIQTDLVLHGAIQDGALHGASAFGARAIRRCGPRKSCRLWSRPSKTRASPRCTGR